MTANPDSALRQALVVYCVICIEDTHGSEAVHIFSTPEKRQAFMDTDSERWHVAYDYTLDAPERHEGRINDH